MPTDGAERFLRFHKLSAAYELVLTFFEEVDFFQQNFSYFLTFFDGQMSKNVENCRTVSKKLKMSKKIK